MCVCVGTVDVFMWCVCMFKYTWNACGSQDNLGCWSSPSTLFEKGSLSCFLLHMSG